MPLDTSKHTVKAFSWRNLIKKISPSKRADAPNNFVSLIQSGKVRVEHVTPDMIDYIEQLGGYEETIAGTACWVIPAVGDRKLGELLGQLRDKGILFVDQQAGWPPAAVFRDLIDRGFVGGDFLAVTWHGPGKWSVRAG